MYTNYATGDITSSQPATRAMAATLKESAFYGPVPASARRASGCNLPFESFSTIAQHLGNMNARDRFRAIQVGDTPIGQVTGITWRSTKIKTFGQSMISLPGGKVSEAKIENFSHPSKNFRIYQVLHFDTKLDPKRITELIYEGLDNAKPINGRDEFEFKWVKMVEVDEIGFTFVCVFDCIDCGLKNSQEHEALVCVIDALRKSGVLMKTQLSELGDSLSAL